MSYLSPANRHILETRLLTYVHPGDTIYTLRRHHTISPNGNSTYWYDVFAVFNGRIIRLTHEVCGLCDLKYSQRHECIQTSRKASELFPSCLAAVLWPHASANKPLIVEEL